MHGCLTDLASAYRDHPTHGQLERVLGEQFTVVEAKVRARAGKEISPNSLQSPDDPEATFRTKGKRQHKGCVTNLSETCDPGNPSQLITFVQTAPNTTEDAVLLVEALPELQGCKGVEVMHNDANFCSPRADETLREQGVVQVPSQVKGMEKDPEALHVDDFQFRENSHGEVIALTCPNGQGVPVEPGRCIARFEAASCAARPFQERCPTHAREKDGGRTLKFSEREADVAQGRRRSAAYRNKGRNLRAAIESTIGAIKRPIAEDQLPVRGLFRVSMMMIGSAAMVNLRRIQRHLAAQARPIPSERAVSAGNGAKGSAPHPLWTLLRRHFHHPKWRGLSCQAA